MLVIGNVRGTPGWVGQASPALQPEVHVDLALSRVLVKQVCQVASLCRDRVCMC